MLRFARVVTADLSVNSVRSTYRRRCLQAARGAAASNCVALLRASDPKVLQRSVAMSQEFVPGKFASKVSGFPALRVGAVSQYRDSQYHCAANPGKEK